MPWGRLLKPQEAADLLGISTKTLKRMRQAGEIPYVEIRPGVFRYPEKSLEKWIRQRTQAVLV